jgi:hypothetical protein
MALIECKECGHSISDSAKSCPNCGKAVPKDDGGFGTLLLILLLAYWAYGKYFEGDEKPKTELISPASQQTSYTSTYNVTYYVEGTANAAEITYQNATGGTQMEEVKLPWQKRIYNVGRRAFVYISAQNQGTSGTVKVRIVVNGSEFKKSESSGRYSIASASGTCCND